MQAIESGGSNWTLTSCRSHSIINISTQVLFLIAIFLRSERNVCTPLSSGFAIIESIWQQMRGYHVSSLATQLQCSDLSLFGHGTSFHWRRLRCNPVTSMVFFYGLILSLVTPGNLSGWFRHRSWRRSARQILIRICHWRWNLYRGIVDSGNFCGIISRRLVRGRRL